MESSSMVPANMQGSMGGASLSSEDDVWISVTRTLAKEAIVLFQLGNYADCLKVLNQLLQKKADDPKILHNITLVEKIEVGFSNPKRFLEALNNLKKRIDSSAENGANGVPNQVPATDSSQGIIDDDLDVSVITFNIAVTLYHPHEYHKCFAILERLYQNIQSVDERVARHICLLLLDVALICHRASRAADVINYLKRVFAGSFGQQQQSTSLGTKSSSESLYESLMSTLDKNGSQNQTRPSKDLQRSQAGLGLKLHLYKARVLLFGRNFKAAKREVKMAMNVARGKDHSLALFLKSQLEYVRGNHRKAIKLLMASSNQLEMATLPLFYNNLGCIYYQLGQQQTSVGFFSKALRVSSPLRKERPLKLLSFSRDKSIFFVYNCGLVYMARGTTVLAVRCFQKAGSIFFKWPLLWLRLAECCMMASEKNSDIMENVIGRGKWRQLIVESWNSRNSLQVEPNLSLTYTKSCLLNALYLLDCSDESKRDLPSNWSPNENPNPVAAGAAVTATDPVNALLQVVWMNTRVVVGKRTR